MSKETVISNALQSVQDTCEHCNKSYSCTFGDPALKTATMSLDDKIKAVTIAYLWEKRVETVSAKCPNTAQLESQISEMEKSL